MPRNPVVNLFTKTPTASYPNDGKLATVGRPRDVRYGHPVHEFERIYAIPRLPLAYITMYSGYYLCAPWKFAGNLKVQEKYRRGIRVVPNFTSKCTECHAEFDKKPANSICPECGGRCRGPSKKEMDKAKRWMMNVNTNHESLKDILETNAHDIVVADEGYIILRKEYLADSDGNIKWQKVKEVIPGSPIVMRAVVDHHTGTPGGVYYVCPGEHRNDDSCRVMRTTNTDDNYARLAGGSHYETEFDAPRCPKCGMKMKDVKYVSIFHERGQIENYYIDGEVIHWHEYDKNHTYVVPPAITLWVPISILTYKDAYIRDSYMKQRKPRGAVVASTSNPDAFMNTWKRIMEEVKNDWQFMPVIPMQPEPGMGSGSNRIAWVDFMGSMQDLEYEKVRNIYERMIYQFYGISNIFANLDSAKGGTNIEAKLIITNKAVERSNRVDNEKPLAVLSKEIGLNDCHFEVAPFEDRDILKEKQIETHDINNAQMMEYIGYRSEFDQTTRKINFVRDTEKEMTRAINIINSLLSIKQGQASPMNTPANKNPVNAKPLTNSNEFSNTSTEVAKTIGDVTMHEGNPEATKESVNRTKTPGAKESGGYKAPDGTVWPTKQALGGHLRTMGGGSSEGLQGSGGMAAPGGDMNQLNMFSKEDYRKVLKLMRENKVTDDYIIDMLDAIVEDMDG